MVHSTYIGVTMQDNISRISMPQWRLSSRTLLSTNCDSHPGDSSLPLATLPTHSIAVPRSIAKRTPSAPWFSQPSDPASNLSRRIQTRLLASPGPMYLSSATRTLRMFALRPAMGLCRRTRRPSARRWRRLHRWDTT